MNESTPTLQNTLYSNFENTPRGYLELMAGNAFKMGYPFFEWNGRVWTINYKSEASKIMFTATDKLYEDLK